MNYFPIWIRQLKNIENKNHHYNFLVTEYLDRKDSMGDNANFLISKHDNFCNILYNNFVKECTGIFGNINFTQDNSKNCWAYVSNKFFYSSFIHDHVETSVINGVYYLHVPEFSEDTKKSSISFYDSNNNEIWNYKPRTDDLLIFPNFLKHKPWPPNSEEFRIAINMEIKCEVPTEFKKNIFFNF